MIVKTKKYKLKPKTYRKLAMANILKSWWWVFLLPLAMIIASVFLGWHWLWITALSLTVVYLLFWFIQFSGIGYLDQFKMLFEKLSYEIDSRQIMIKLSPKQGMPIPWEKVQKAKKTKDGFIIVVTKAQIIHLPNKVFNSQNEMRFLESILKRKGFIKE